MAKFFGSLINGADDWLVLIKWNGTYQNKNHKLAQIKLHRNGRINPKFAEHHFNLQVKMDNNMEIRTSES